MATAFAKVYNTVALTYHVKTGGKTEDDAGKEAFPTEPRSVRAFLDTPSEPVLRAQIGADTVTVDYEGRLTDPPLPPAGFVTGTAVEFEMDGRTIKGRVIVFAPSPLKRLDKRMGRRIQVTADG